MGMHRNANIKAKKTKQVFATNKPNIVNVNKMRNHRSQRLRRQRVAETMDSDSLDNKTKEERWNA